MSSFDTSGFFPAPEDPGTSRAEMPAASGQEGRGPLLCIPVGGIGSRVAVEEIIRRIREDAENAKDRFQFLMIDTDGETGAEPDTDGEEE